MTDETKNLPTLWTPVGTPAPNAPDPQQFMPKAPMAPREAAPVDGAAPSLTYPDSAARPVPEFLKTSG
jgi:hypothetical protein